MAASEPGGNATTRAVPKYGSWIATNDYPEVALKQRMMGGVSVRYEIDERGRVIPGSCAVTATSKYAILDATTCKIVEGRFRFEPAKENGRLVKEIRNQFFHWSRPDWKMRYDATDVVRLVQSRGTCLALQQSEAARRLLGYPIGSEEQTSGINAVDNRKSRCWSEAEIETPPLLVAGGMAEQFVLDEHANVDAAAVVSASKAFVPRNEVEAIAHCVLQRNAGAALELMDTAPTGPDEARVVAKLVPDLGPCVSQGTSLTFNKPTVRSLVALALHQSLTARPVGQSPARR